MRLFDQGFFEWDDGNLEKSSLAHKVSTHEAEEAFLLGPVKILEDTSRSVMEKRFMLLGLTRSRRHLSVFYTIRKGRVRIISARDMNQKERHFYEKETKTDS